MVLIFLALGSRDLHEMCNESGGVEYSSINGDACVQRKMEFERGETEEGRQ